MAGKLRPVTEALKDSLDSVATHGRRVADLPGKHKSKIDTDVQRMRATDRDAATMADSPSTRPDSGRDSGGDQPERVPFPDPPPPFNRANPELADRALVDRFDGRTPTDGAVFWSGRKNDGNGVMEDAAQYAEAHDGMTLEQLLEQQGMTGDMPSDWSDPSTTATWQAVSEKLAASASGDVTAVHGEVRDASVWNSVEFPALVRNDSVSSISIVDGNTGEIVKVYERG